MSDMQQVLDTLIRTVGVKWEIITPTDAATILGMNTGNRHPKPKRQAQLERDIAQGRFIPNGETIIIGKTRLLNGQNRLLACIRADRPFISLVVRGIDDHAFDSMDQVTPRSVVDKLRTMGHVSNPTGLASALSILWRFDTGRYRNAFGWQMHPTIGEALATLSEHPEVEDAVATIGAHARSVGFPTAAISAMSIICGRTDSELAEGFFARLVSGEKLTADEPVYLLRRRFDANRTAKAKLTVLEQSILIVKAWNATRGEAEMKQLKSRRRKVGEAPTSETFPEIK